MTRRFSSYRPLGGLAALALGAGLLVLPASSALAADTVPQLPLCDAPHADGVVTIVEDLDDTAVEVVVDCDVTIDLAGHQVIVRNVVLGPGAEVTVADSVGGGGLAARADLVPDPSPEVPAGVPGIRLAGGTLVVAGGEIEAYGATGAAGIGGGPRESGDLGVLRIEGGEVRATGGRFGAGIGTGAVATASGTVEVAGDAEVTAAGGVDGAGVGGGAGSAGLAVTVAGGELTALAGDPGSNSPAFATSAVGSGAGPGAFGSLAVTGGILRLPDLVIEGFTPPWTNVMIVRDSNRSGAEIVVGPSGRIDGGARFVGAGQIDNQGAVTVPTDNLIEGGVQVQGRHYQIDLDPGDGAVEGGVESVRVFADTLGHGDRTLPAATLPGFAFEGWTRDSATPDALLGADDLLTEDGESIAGEPAPFLLFAVWRELDPSGSAADLGQAFGECEASADAPYRVTLDDDLTDPDLVVPVACPAVLDLHGHDLTVGTVDIAPAGSLRIEDSTATATDPGGTLTASSTQAYRPGIGVRGELAIASGRVDATGGTYAAGIGGRYRSQFGDIRIDGGEVVAHGGESFAGIGGGAESRTDASTVAVNGGTVTATGGGRGPGIGEVGTVAVAGGTVVATGGVGASGIGGMQGSRGSAVSISGGDVTAVGGAATDDHPTGSAVGAGGSAYRIPDFGHLEVSGGTLRLPSGVLRISAVEDFGTDPRPEVVVSGSGRVVGAADVVRAAVWPSDEGGPGETSAGSIRNDGAITLPTANLTGGLIPIAGRHYELTLDAGEGELPEDAVGPVTVFADTLANGARSLPAPTRSGFTFDGWATEADVPVTSTTDLTALLAPATGGASTATLHARWTAAGSGGTAPSGSGPSDVVVPTPTLASTGDVTAPRVGDRLTASVTGLAAGATVSWQWWRSGPGGAGPIAGATAAAYDIGPDDVGARLHVVATGRQAGYGDGSAPSAGSGPVARGLLGSPLAVTDDRDGHPVVGAPVTAALTRPRVPGAAVTWQWQTREGSAAWADVVGATAATHVPAAAEAGRTLRVVATVTAPGYETATVDHEVGAVAPAAAPDAGVSLHGRARVGRSLVARLDQPLAAGQTVTWAWERRTAAGWRTVSGAEGAAYGPTRADVGHRLRVVATITTPGHEVRVVRAVSPVVKRANRADRS